MRYPKHRNALRGAFCALLTLGVLLPGALHAQDEPEPVDEARIVQYARAHLAIAEARDEFHGEVARVHDEEGRLRAREEVDARIGEILTENEMTREEYDGFILRISLDGELRAAFEEALVQLQEEPSAPA